MGTAVLALGACVTVAACGGGGGGAQDGGPPGLLVLDVRNGHTRWQSSAGRDGSIVPGLGSGLVAAATSRCGTGTERPRVEALDAGSGDGRWTVAGFGAVATTTMTWSDTPTVDVASRGIVVATGGRLVAPIPGIDAATGAVRWKITSPERFLGVSETLVFGASPNGGALDGFDRRTGTRRWTFPAGADASWGRMFDVVAANATTLVVANGSYTNQGPTTMYVVDADRGTELTRFTAAEPAIPFSDFVIHDGLLVYADGVTVLGRDLHNGAIRWSHPSGEARPSETTGVPRTTVRASNDGGTVFVGTNRGFRDVLDAGTGAIRWRASPARFFEAATSSRVLVSTAGGSLEALDIGTGRRQWTRNLLDAFALTRGAELGITARGRTVAVSPRCDDG